MRLLDLFCGGGGAAVGYARAGFDVVGVDIEPQPRYPFECFQDDALDFLEGLLVDRTETFFDVIHASPPCQAYSSTRAINLARWGKTPEHPDLVKPVRDLLQRSGLPYVIENVPRSPLLNPLVLCGSMFDLRVRWHRLFESNTLLFRLPCAHVGHDFVGVYGDHPETATFGIDGYNRKPRASTIDEAKEAMGIDWMQTWKEVKEAIPPAYTEWIGKQLIEQLERAA